jgi:hypothetical protein
MDRILGVAWNALALMAVRPAGREIMERRGQELRRNGERVVRDESMENAICRRLGHDSKECSPISETVSGMDRPVRPELANTEVLMVVKWSGRSMVSRFVQD